MKNHYIIDEEYAWVVRKIFEMYVNGEGRGNIVRYLRDNRIPLPSAVLHMRGIRYFRQMEVEENRYRWSNNTLSKLFENPAYIGDTAHYRVQRPTNKSKPRKNKPEDVLYIKGTHEPIIDMDTWNAAHREMASHPARTKKHENIFLSIAKCADCGKGMNMNCTTNHRKKGIVKTFSLACDTYKKYSRLECSCHYVNYRHLCELVRQSINEVIAKVRVDEKRIIEKLRRLSGSGAHHSDGSAKKLAKIEKRLSEIERIYAKLYEDKVLEIVSAENFRMLSDKLQAEQKSLRDELAAIQKRSAEYVKSEENIQSFIALIRSMEQIETLDRTTVVAMIDRIEICEKQTDEDGKQSQQIDIFFKFIGKAEF